MTGGSRGIGLSVARALMAAGASVAVAARHRDDLDAARHALGAAGGRVHAVTLDVRDRQACFDAVAAVEAAFGPLDILVNNAGTQGPIGPIDELPPDRWIDTIAVNLLGPVWMLQAALPGMKRRRHGSIINLSGGGATGPREHFSAYAASKTALVRLTETVAREVAAFGVRVNAVAPGAVATRMVEEIERAGDRAGDRALREVRELRENGGTPPELAGELVAFLASDAAAHVTGRLLSAVWDDWRGLRDGTFHVADTEWFTLRRVAPERG